jgi:hypothetical protein
MFQPRRSVRIRDDTGNQRAGAHRGSAGASLIFFTSCANRGLICSYSTRRRHRIQSLLSLRFGRQQHRPSRPRPCPSPPRLSRPRPCPSPPRFSRPRPCPGPPRPMASRPRPCPSPPRLSRPRPCPGPPRFSRPRPCPSPPRPMASRPRPCPSPPRPSRPRP